MEEVPQFPNNDRSHHVYMKITDLDGKLYSNQTGCFPITSNRGSCYVVILYSVDGNYIKAYPIKSRHFSQLLKVYDDVYAFFRVCRYIPQLHKMDNKTSKDVENFVAEQQAKVQCKPSDIHLTNINELCCCTRKNHFTTVRSVTPFSFCMENCCKMLEQCHITLNMM